MQSMVCTRTQTANRHAYCMFLPDIWGGPGPVGAVTSGLVLSSDSSEEQGHLPVIRKEEGSSLLSCPLPGWQWQWVNQWWIVTKYINWSTVLKCNFLVLNLVLPFYVTLTSNVLIIICNKLKCLTVNNTQMTEWARVLLYDVFSCLPPGDTFSSSPSTTPRGSQESLSSHSSEKNGLSQTSPPSSPAAEASSSSPAPASPPASPPAASTDSHVHISSNEQDQKRLADSAASPHLTPSSSWTSSQLTPAQQTSSVSSSTSSLVSAERTLSVKGNSNASLSSVKESRSPSRASTSTTSTQPASVECASSLRPGQPVQRASSISSLKSVHSVDQINAPSNSSTLTETKVTDSTSRRTAYRMASSSSSSSSSLFPYQLSTSSSLTSLHISEGAYNSDVCGLHICCLCSGLIYPVLLQITKAVMDRFRVSCRSTHKAPDLHANPHTSAMAPMWLPHTLPPYPPMVTRDLDPCECQTSTCSVTVLWFSDRRKRHECVWPEKKTLFDFELDLNCDIIGLIAGVITSFWLAQYQPVFF